MPSRIVWTLDSSITPPPATRSCREFTKNWGYSVYALFSERSRVELKGEMLWKSTRRGHSTTGVSAAIFRRPMYQNLDSPGS